MLENMDFIDQESEEIEEKLKQMRFTSSDSDSNVVMTADGTGEILDIEISSELIQEKDKEAIEDSVLIAINKLREKVSEVQARESENLFSKLFSGM